MENKKNIIKVIIIAVALGGVALLSWLIFREKPSVSPVMPQNTLPSKENNETKKEEEKAVVPSVAPVEGESLPEEFPAGMPVNKQTEKINAYALKYPNSTQTQSLYSFYSSETMDQNLAFYQDWAKKNSWKTLDTIKDKDQYSLFLLKDTQSMGIKIFREENKTKVNFDLLK